MQQKRSRSRITPLLLGLIVAVVVTTGVLATRTIPAPQQPLEIELDAKALLEAKPAQ